MHEVKLGDWKKAILMNIHPQTFLKKYRCYFLRVESWCPAFTFAQMEFCACRVTSSVWRPCAGKRQLDQPWHSVLYYIIDLPA